MKKQSIMRSLKRKALREQGMTFTDRVREAVRLHQPVRNIKYEFNAQKAKQTT